MSGLCAGLGIGWVNTVAQAAPVPDEAKSVVVVYNFHSKESKDVAEHYAKARGVPESQLLGLKLPRTENMSRVEYRKLLQEPLLDWLEKGRHWVYAKDTTATATNAIQAPVSANIRYAVLCYEVPLKIDADASIREPGGEKAPKELRRNEAAVDSELALLPLRGPGVLLTGPAVNRTYGATNRFMLHPTNGVLIVTRLDGPTPEIARALVDKAMEAETNGLWGRAYFDLRGLKEGNFKPGDDLLRNAAKVTTRQGFETVIEETEPTLPKGFPLSQIAFYGGWYAGDVNGPFLRKDVEFMPGAFAYHLHSFSANTLHSTTRNWCGPLLARCATATMGCVFEPYLGGTPDIGMVLSRWIDLGFSYGEAALAGQGSLSWQTTVIGDPLYRPFVRSAREIHEDLEKRASPWLEWSHLRIVNLNLVSGLREPQVIPYLEAIPLTKQSAVLMEKFSDLCVASGKPGAAVDYCEAALKAHPSPIQRERLTFKLLDLLVASGDYAKALVAGDEFLKDKRDYPDLSALYRKMSVWAARVGDANEAARYEKLADLLNR